MPRRTRSAFGTVAALPSGRWRVRYTGPDGRKYSAPTTFDSRREAEAWLIGAQADVLRGTWSPATTTAPVTLGEYLPTYFGVASQRLRPSTLGLYDRLADRFLAVPVGLTGNRVALSTVPLAALTTPLVRDWFNALCVQLEHSTARQAPNVSAHDRRRHPARAWATSVGMDVPPTGRLPRRVLAAWQAAGSPMPQTLTAPGDGPRPGRTQAAQAYRLLRAVLSQAVEDGLIDRNPAHVRGAGVTHPAERHPLTPAEVAALADAIAPHVRAAVLLAAYSGLRPGEVFALRRRDFSLAAQVPTVSVERTQTRTRDRRPAIGAPKTTAGRRTVTLPASVADAVARHLATYTGPDPDALAFSNASGTPVGASDRSRLIAPAREVIGRRDVTWHHLRHTGATLAAQAGATLAELQARIGHASPAAAMIYQHAAQARDAEIAAALDTYAATPSNVIPLRRAI